MKQTEEPTKQVEVTELTKTRSYYRMIDNAELIELVDQGERGAELCWVLRERLEDLLREEQERQETAIVTMLRDSNYDG